MTVPSGKVVFNADTGSDIQASGCGPSVAKYGSSASTTAASNVVTGIDTTDVQVGDLLWVASSSGRQFSFIASITSSTECVCDDAFDNTETISWAIGGKRATFDHSISRNLFQYISNNDLVIETETDQVLTSNITRYGGVTRFIGNGKTLSCTGNFHAFSFGQGHSGIFDHFKFTSVVGNTSSALTGGYVTAQYCVFGERGADTNFQYGCMGIGYGCRVNAFRCKFYGRGSTSNDIAIFISHYNSGGAFIHECSMFDCRDGLYGNSGVSQAGIRAKNCIISNCSYGLRNAGFHFGTAEACIFHNITNDAFYCAVGPNISSMGTVDFCKQYGYLPEDNVFINVGGYLANFGTDVTSGLSNADMSSSSGFLSWYQYNSPNGTLGFDANITALTADPFIDAENGDFNLNNVAGGGAVLRAAQYTL